MVRTVFRVAAATAGVGWAVTLLWLKPYAATPVALDAMADGNGVDVESSASRITMAPDAPAGAGIVMYPGALVDPQAYAALLRPFAEQGHPVVIVKFPLNIAFLDVDAADDVIDGDPDRPWVVAGHSLGGAVGAGAAVEAGADGLLLLGAYPIENISGADLAVSSVYGSEDGLTTPADVEANRPNLPATTSYVEIVGGVHSFFGDYGEQRGDGTPTISREEAQTTIRQATQALLGELGP